MGSRNYFQGATGFTPVAWSSRFGDTPGGRPVGQGTGSLYSFNEGGNTRYFLPNEYAAGNAWSSATPNSDYIRSLGGTPYTTQSTTDRSGFNSYQGNNTTPGYSGWAFDNLPDFSAIENNSTFNPGRGTSNRSFNEGFLALAAAAGGGAALSGMGGGMAPISGGGTLSSTTAIPGSALTAGGTGAATTGTGALGSSIPAYTPAMNAAGMAAGGNASVAGTTAAGAGGLSGLWDTLSSGAGRVGDWLATPQGTYAGLGLADLGLRLNQQNELEDLMNEAANRADAFQQPQRFPYQGLLSQYLQDGESIANQPYVRANMDFALDTARANMARTGRSGGGGAERELVDYTNKVFEANALPYLNQLSGMAGFGFGPGNSGQLYGQYGAMASAMPSVGLSELARAFGLGQPTAQPWQNRAYNSQQQMMGLGEGRDWRLS